ncbi:MAG: helix-turn-helix domain-containing protein [Gemmataceae bacterium]|nr:helix-turn-helix domain-containing protein [Gemmataceae bacterium]
MNPESPWGDALPLTGCAVVPPRELTPRAPPKSRPARSQPAVVKKVLALNRFLDRTAGRLTSAAALVWMMLLRDERGGVARTAVTDLARRCGLSVRTVKRRLAELKALGVVEVLTPGTRSSGPTGYQLHATAPDEG